MAYNVCVKHPSSKAVGKCSDCKIYVCGSCRRYWKGSIHCKECYKKHYYKENKHYKDKLHYGKYKHYEKTSSSSIISLILQLLIVGIIGLIVYKVALKNGVITKDTFKNLSIKKMVNSIKKLNPSSAYKNQFTSTRIQSFKKSLDMYNINYGSYPETFDEFLNKMFDKNKRVTISKDAWGNKFIYNYDEYNDVYKIISKGPDKKLDTKDDIILTNEDF